LGTSFNHCFKGSYTMSNNTWAAFGTLTGANDENSVQSSIPRALSYLSERDQSTFRKKFSEQSVNEHQAMHTFRELLVGVFMVQQGHLARYEPIIDGLTPDWRFQRDGCGMFIADVVNLHVERDIEAQINQALDQGHAWFGAIPDQSQRLHSSLWDKAIKYKNLAAKKSVPYVVFIFGWTTAVVQSQQIEQCLLHAEGLFRVYPTLSGVYHMYERGNCLQDRTAGYRFDYYPNPTATYPAGCLANGALPYGFPSNSNPLGGQ
jgi:hypothetical protein